MADASVRRIPAIKLNLQPLDEKAAAAIGFRFAGDEIGTRHRLGGDPQWLQGEEVPVCRDCKQRMSFYGQFDSIGDRFTIADCGMIYVFFCFDCNQAEAVVQSF
jgi:hypothetical protein